MRSVDAFVVPLTVAVGLSLIVIAADRRLLQSDRAGGQWSLRVAEGLATVVGLVLLVIGMAYVVGASLIPGDVIPALSLAIGALSLPYAATLRRRRVGSGAPAATAALAVWVATFVLVGVGLFLAIGDYSARVGTGRAQATVTKLAGSPSVILFSTRGLALTYTGAQETVCPGIEGTYRYRYDGLKLILQSGNTYMLIPERWSPANGQAILLPRQDGVRLDYSAPGSAVPPPACH